MNNEVLNSMLESRLSSLEDKKQSLSQASDFKRGVLSRNIEKLSAIEARDEKSWAGRLNLNPDQDPVSFTAVNAAANLWAGAVDVERQIASATLGLKSAALSAHIPQEVRDARARQLTGAATAEDTALLSLPEGMTKKPKFMTQWQADDFKKARTNQERIQSWEKTQDDIKTVQGVMDADGVVYKGNQAALTSQLAADAWDMNEKAKADARNGLKHSLLDKAGAIAKSVVSAGMDNPMATAELVVRNAPQLLLSANKVGSVITNGAYAFDEFNKGVAAYRETNDGAMPSERQMQGMAAVAASLAGAEMLGDKLTLGAGKSLKAAANGVETAVDSLGRAGLKTALGIGAKGINNAVGRTALAGVEGAAGEYLTEGYQHIAENALQGKESTFLGEDGVHVAGSMGALAGGHTSMGIGAVGEATKLAAPSEVGASVAAAVGNSKKAAVEKAAIASGDSTIFLDEKSPSYDLIKGMSALFQSNMLETTDEATKQANHQKAAGIVESLATKMETLQADLPEGKAKVQEQLTAAEAQLASLDPAQVDKAKDLQFEIDFLKEELARPALEGDALKAAQKEYAKLQKTHTQATTLLQEQTAEARKQQTTVTPEALTAHVAAATAPVDVNDSVAIEAATKSANVVLNLSMISPEKVDAKTALAVANNLNNGLTEQQRSYLRTLPEAKAAENLLKSSTDVSREIYFGNKAKEMVGIADYRSNLSNALAVGNKKLAERQFSGIVKFLESHQDKAEKAKQALALSNIRVPGEGRKAQQVVRTDKGWVVEPLSLSDEDLRKNGGLKVHRNSDKDGFITGIGKEAAAIGSAIAEMEAAYELKFGSKPAITATVKVPAAPTTQQPTNTQTQGVNNGTQTSQTVEAKAQRSEAPTTPGITGTDQTVTKPEPSPELKTEENVDPVDTSEGYVENQPENEQIDAGYSEWDTYSTEKPTQADQVTPTEETAATAEKYSGLDLLSQYKKDLTGNLKDLFTKLNLVAQFFVQKKANDRYTTTRPLVAQKDFLTAWGNAETFPSEFLEQGADLTAEQFRALDSLYVSMKEWLPILRKSFVPFSGKESERNYKHLDMSHYFLEDADGNPAEVEENVLAALAYSAYQWVLGESNSPARKTQKEINALHSKTAEAWIHRDGVKVLQGMSSMESTFVNDLGTVAVQALGLKLRDDAPQNLLPNLQVAMGSHILALLEKQELIRRVALPADQVNDYFMSDEELADEGRSRMTDEAWQQKWAREPKTKTYQYIQFARNTDMSLKPEAQAIKSANYKSGDVVNKLFGADVAPMMAHTEPQKFTQETAQKTNQEISKLQREVIQKTMEIPHRVIPAMMGMFGALGSQALLEIAGAVDTSKTKVHKVNRDSVQAQNDNVQNQLDLLQEQIAQDPSGEEYAQEYFVSASVWRNFRAGFMNAAMNLQTSKIHRFMFARPDWTTTIKVDDVAMVNEFKIAIAMNLGLVKTDQQTNAESLAMFEAKMAAPDSKAQKAVNAIRENMLAGTSEWTNETLELIKDVSVKGEGMMTLQALVAYAEYEHALATKSADFTVTLLVGADGKTNGPILTHLALGAAGDVDGLYVLLNRGGMYSTDEGQAEHYSAYYQGGKGKDLYQDLSSNTITRIKSNVVSQETMDALAGTKEAKSLVTEAEFAAVQTITKDLMVGDEVTSAGRNLVKTPLTSFAFGSSLKKSIENMENKFIESFYEAIENIANGNAKGLTLEKLLADANLLIKRGNPKAKELSTNASITSMLERELTTQQERALRKAFREVVGTSVKEEMETYFATFIQRRADLNKSIQAAYAVYAAAYADARIAEIKRLMAEGKIAYRVSEKGENKGKQVPLHDLTVAQEKKLRDMFMDMAPVMHTAYSQAEDSINAGLYMAKSENGVSDASVYQNKVKLGVPLKNGQKNVNSASTTRREISPGVAGVPYFIHSLDSANMHMALAEVGLEQSMNVHDEIGNGVGKIAKAAEAINRTTAENFLNFSPAREAARRLEEMVISMSQRVYAGTVSQEAVKKMFDDWAEIYNKGIMEPELHITPEMAGQVMMNMTMQNAFSADHLRLGAFAKMGVIDQYTWEGGQFKVTPELRKQAEEAIKKLPTGPSENFQQAIKYLEFIYDKNPNAAAVYPEWANQDQTMDEEFDAAPQAESTSQLGAPGVVASVVVEAIAEQIPEVAQAVSEGVSVVEAINQQPLQERTKAIQAIADAAHSVPSSLYSPWGAIGTPSVDTDWALVNAFEQRGGEMTGAEAHAVLTQLFANSKHTPETKFQLQILEQTRRMIPADLKVIYVTPNTPMSAALEKPADRSRGWYQTNAAGQKVLYILSHQHAHAMVDKEVLAHELLHAALGQTIQEVLNGGGTSEAKAAVKDLQGLLEKTKEFMATNHALNTKFAPAIVDVHELVTWGMTNREFQQEVLEQVSYAPTKLQKDRQTGLAKFIRALADLVFPKAEWSSKARAQTGLFTLIANVSDLFHAEAANKTQLDLALNLSQINTNPMATVQGYTTEDIYDALPGSASPAFDGQLRDLLSGLVAKLHGPAGSLKAELMQNQTITATDVWNKAQVTGQAPFASKLKTSGFIHGEREAFVADQVEAVMRGALSDDSSSNFVARDTLAKLFKEAHSRIKPQDFYRGSDWSTATPEEQQKATDEWKFIFTPEAGQDKRSDFLSRFAALGLASERFNAMLQFNTAENDVKFGDQKTLAAKLKWVFDKALDFFNGKLTQTFGGQRADAQLSTLVDQLVTIEAKRRGTVAKSFVGGVVGMFEDGATRVAGAARDKAVAFAKTDFVRNNTFTAVKLVGAAARIVLPEKRLELATEMAQDMRDKYLGGRRGLVSSLVDEVRGPKAVVQALLRATKHLEGLRKSMITNTSKLALGSFVDGGSKLTKEGKAAITSVLLRTDAQVLLGKYDLEQIQSLLENKKELAQAIKDHIGELTAYPDFVHYFVKQSKLLGYKMATGRIKGKVVMLNAGNIAQLYQTGHEGKLSSVETAKAEMVIDRLATLYALAYVPTASKEAAIQVIRGEAQRTDKGNGIEMVLKLHKKQVRDAAELLFLGNESLITKGYTPEIYNPYIDVQVAHTAEEAQELLDRGYSPGAKVGLDPNDPNQVQGQLYKLQDGGLPPRQTGIISFSGDGTKGSTLHDGNLNLSTPGGAANQAKLRNMNAARRAAMAQMFQPDPGFNPQAEVENYMAPVMNASGGFSNWRYMMHEDTKDTLLERNNDFDQILGVLSGSILDKQSTQEQNHAAIQAMREQYEAGFASKPSGFIKVSHDSPDAEMQEVYRLLPEVTRQSIRQIWGRDGMMVPIEMVNIMFGYQKYTMSSMWDKKREDRTRTEQAITMAAEIVIGQYAKLMPKALGGGDAEEKIKRIAVIVRKGGRIWKEIVREMKDIIVVRSIKVMADNIKSNMSLLFMYGVPPSKWVKLHREAIKGLTAYQRDSAELFRLQTKLNTGYTRGDEQEIQDQITLLEDHLARNPVKDLIDAGMMPTIVEDVGADDDQYSYRSQLTKWVDNKTGKLHPLVKEAGKQLYMGKGTQIYQSLSKITQASDFVARYTLYQHLTTRDSNPMTREQAIQEASDAFINYDIPMHKGMQWLDDHGFVMFTKYFLRIQRVLMKLTREKPANVMMTLAVGNYLDMASSMATNASALGRIGNNPFSPGALMYPGTVDELASIQALMGLVK